MMVENHFPQDTRVKNEATCSQRPVIDVSVIALREKGQISNRSGKRCSGLPCATIGAV